MAPTNGHGKPRLTLDAALDRTQKKLALIEGRNKLRAHQMIRTRQKKILESYEAWEWLSGYSDMLDRMRGPDRDLLLPVSTAQDRRCGDNWPFWRSWVEHSRLRAASRLLCQMSPLADGALRSLTSYVIGEGMVARPQKKRPDCPKPLLEAIQEWLDEFCRVNAWQWIQQELFYRSRRDGEYFLRIFPQDDGMTLVRTVEPEHVIEPGDQPRDIASYGIVVDPEDLWDVRGYFVSYSGSAADGEYLSGAEVWHYKENVDRQIKRGMPDFAYDTLDLYKTVGRLLENMGQGAAIQAAIAFVRQHESASPAMVNSFIGSTADYQNTQPFTGASRNVMRFEPGTVIDMDAGQSFQETSFGANVGNYIQAVQSLLRACAVRWNAPEWVVSADNSSVNYASSLTSESPFTKRCKQLQASHKAIFHDVVQTAFRHYVRRKGGFRVQGTLYDYRQLRALVDLQTVPPSVETRDKSQEATMNKTYIELGIKSRQTTAAELGLDYEVEERNNEEFEAKHGEQGVPQEQRTAEGGDDGALAAMGGGGGGGGGEGADGSPGNAPQNPQKAQKGDSEGAPQEDDGLGDLGAMLASLTETMNWTEQDTAEWLIEAAASKDRKPGDKWPSESNPNRWFWKNPQTGRVTPYKPTEEEKAKAKNTPNNSASIRQSPPDNTATSAKPKAAPPAKPAPKAATPKKTAAPKQPTATLDDVKAQLTAMRQGQGDPEGLMGALLGLGLADIRKLRDEYQGAGGGRSKNDVAQRLIDKVKADMAAEKAAKEQPVAKPTALAPAQEPAPATPAAPAQASDLASLPPVPPGKKLSKDYPEEGIRVVTDANGDNRTTLTTPSPEAVKAIAPVLKKAFEMALWYRESAGGLVPLNRLVTEIERATPEGQKITKREIFDALAQMDRTRAFDLKSLNETWALTDRDKADGMVGPLGDYNDPDGATFWQNGRAKHFVTLASGVGSIDQAIQKASAGSTGAKQDKPGFTGTDALGREWQDGKLVAAKDEPTGPGKQGKQAEPAPAAKPAAVKPQPKQRPPKPAKPEPKPTPAPAAKPEVTTDTIRQTWDKLPGAKDNLVSLADLQDALGVDTPTLHRLVNDLRRKGVLTAQNLEGRTGTQAEKDRLKAAGIPDGQNTIGYVAMMDAGQGQTPTPASKPASDIATFGRSSKAKLAGPLPPEGGAILGNQYTPEVLASLAGAPDDSMVKVQIEKGTGKGQGDRLRVFASKPGYTTDQRLFIDGQGKKVARLSGFHIHPSLQGKGIGSRVFSEQVANLQKAGFDRVEMSASRTDEENGHYTWAVLGADQAIAEFEPDRAKVIRKAFPQAKTVQDILAAPGGRLWWRQNGYSMDHAVFDLKPGSRSIQVLQQYQAERSGR